MASARYAGHLIGNQRIHDRGVNGIFLKTSRAQMAVQTLAVAVASGNADGIGRRTYVLEVKPSYTAQLVL